MVGKTKAPNKQDRARFRAFQRIGCIACRIEGRPMQPADVHHKAQAGGREGHQISAPLCPWHHRGVRPGWLPTDRDAEHVLGPSLARSKRQFIARYGTEDELIEATDRLLIERGLIGSKDGTR